MCPDFPLIKWSNHRIVAYSGVGYCDHDLDIYRFCVRLPKMGLKAVA